MRLSLEELTANIDDDFKAVVEKLQRRSISWPQTCNMGAPHILMVRWRRGKARCYCSGGLPGQRHIRARKVYPILLRPLIAGRSRRRPRARRFRRPRTID